MYVLRLKKKIVLGQKKSLQILYMDVWGHKKITQLSLFLKIWLNSLKAGFNQLPSLYQTKLYANTTAKDYTLPLQILINNHQRELVIKYVKFILRLKSCIQEPSYSVNLSVLHSLRSANFFQFGVLLNNKAFHRIVYKIQSISFSFHAIFYS